jgi:nucleoside-diphosphate-sugar epimerase
MAEHRCRRQGLDVPHSSRLVVSGCAGFIGSHLCESLLGAGHQVLGIDNLVTGTRFNLEPFAHHPGFEFIVHDACDPLPETIHRRRFDAVLHLASPASPKDYAELPIETLWVNAVGTRHLLDLARDSDARFVLASTSEVYGDPLVSPQTEDYSGNANPIGPRGCYNEGKRYAEALVKAYERRLGIDHTIVRIFNCYGPRMRQDDGRVIPQFIIQCLRGEPLTIYGSGRQDRSFCYVSDLVRGIVAATFSPHTHRQVMNLGSPEPISILGLAQAIRRLTGSRSEIRHLALPEDDPQTRCPDIERARRWIGFAPEVGLETGLQATIAYFQRVLTAGPAAAVRER